MTEGPGKSKSNPAGFSGEKIEELLKTLFPNEKEQLHVYQKALLTHIHYYSLYSKNERNQLCRDKGIDARIVMTWCGHSSERMIMQIYDHPSESREKRMIELMDK